MTWLNGSCLELTQDVPRVNGSDRLTYVELSGHALTPEALWEICKHATDSSWGVQVGIGDEAWRRVDRSSDFIAKLIEKGETVYGINTGFGHFAERPVPPSRLAELQENLIRSHAAGVGVEISRDIVLAMWLLRLNTMCRGHSGNRESVMKHAIRLIEAGVLGCVPSRGSVGASGDLAPSAHAVLPLLGEGFCTRPTTDKCGFERIPASQALADIQLEPLKLAPKEGLALINGTQYSTSLAIKAWMSACRLWRTANLTAAISMEAMGGAGSIFESSVLSSHHLETSDAGIEMANWLAGSEYLHGARREGRLAQAPYCLRCAPQVHGAILRELRMGHATLQSEINALCDNPLVFPEEDAVYSCGNFHALYPARVSDALASAMTTLASISERRINMAMDGKLSGLPTFLIADGGLNSGLMMVQTTAAALVCEARALSSPASADSIPTNCDREDHVSMGPVAGLKALQIANLAQSVLSIELVVACQALELRKGVAMPHRIGDVLRKVRENIPFICHDRILSPMLASGESMIETGVLFDNAKDWEAVLHSRSARS